MRMNLFAQIPAGQYKAFETLSLTLTLKSAVGLPGQSELRTTPPELFRLLDQQADVNQASLERFRKELREAHQAKLRNVQLSEETLEALGFFID